MPALKDAPVPWRGGGRLTTPARVALVLAALLVVLAGYFYLVPIPLQTKDGVFWCGSAMSPPTGIFPRNVCQQLPDVYRARAIALLVAALTTTVLGTFLFREGDAERGDEMTAADLADDAS